MEIALVIGILGFMGFLIYIATNLNDDHVVLKFLLFSIVFVLIPVFANLILKIAGTSALLPTAQMFFKVCFWLVRMFWVYLFLFVIWKLLDYTTKIPAKIRKAMMRGRK